MTSPLFFLLAAFFSFGLNAAPVNPAELEPDWDFWETPSVKTKNPVEARRLSSINSDITDPKKRRAKTIRLLIDPGHGGRDYGTKTGAGYLEKKLTLKLGLLLKDRVKGLLESKGYPVDVLLTRDADQFLTLRDRTRLANTWEADLFISLHANSEPTGSARGFEVYFTSPEATDQRANRLALLENSEKTGEQLPSNPVIKMLADSQNSVVHNESARFAEVMFEVLASYLESSVRAVRQAPFSVLAHTVMPSLLIEVGYFSHPTDTRRLKNPRYLKKVADAISQGVLEYVTRQPGNRAKN